MTDCDGGWRGQVIRHFSIFTLKVCLYLKLYVKPLIFFFLRYRSDLFLSEKHTFQDASHDWCAKMVVGNPNERLCLSAFAICPSASFVKRLARVLSVCRAAFAVQRHAVEPVTPGYLKNDFLFFPELSLSLSRASHLRTLFSWRRFHGPTSRYGNRAAAGDRKLISELSELAMQPGMCHLGVTKIQPGSVLSSVQINESGSTEAWALGCDRVWAVVAMTDISFVKKKKEERKKALDSHELHHPLPECLCSAGRKQLIQQVTGRS